MLRNWISIDDTPMTEAEMIAGDTMADIRNVASMQMTALDERAQPRTTVLVLNRPTETLLISIRVDGSIVIASDES